MTASAWRVVKWTLIAYGSIVGVGAAIVIGLVFYVVNSGPDFVVPASSTRSKLKTRAETRREQR